MGRLAAALAFVALLLSGSPAHADARVSVGNSQGSAAIDPTYMTTLNLSGSGFQAIKGGYGGIYVQFGAKSGSGYLKLPDERDNDNAGYVRFIAFPDGTTSSDAASEMSDDGDWSTTLNVPGATFTAENGSKVDCRSMTCGVITIGAHGVANANNETFTEVDVEDLNASQDEEDDNDSTSDASSSTNSTATSTTQGAAATPSDEAAKRPSVPAKLTVDRAAARPGRIVAFTAVGLTPGAAVNATFSNGLAAAGPLTVNAAGEVAGLIQLPTDVDPGTYELRLVGGEDMPSARFAVIAEAGRELSPWIPYAFAGTGLLALLGSAVFGVLRWRRLRHAS